MLLAIERTLQLLVLFYVTVVLSAWSVGWATGSVKEQRRGGTEGWWITLRPQPALSGLQTPSMASRVEKLG